MESIYADVAGEVQFTYFSGSYRDDFRERRHDTGES